MERSYVRRIGGLGVMLGWLAASAPGQITTNIWDGESSTDWMTAANWTNSTANDVALADGNAVEFYAVGNNLSTILGQDWIIDRLIFNAGADSDVTIGGANTLTISNGIIVDADSAGAHAILANVALAQNQTWTINTNTSTLGNNLLVGGVISGDATLTKAGTGNLTLTNSNTYTGGTLVNAGILVLNHDNAAGGGGITLQNTATRLQLGDGVNVSNSLIIGNTGNQKVLTVAAATTGLYSGTILVQEVGVGNFDIDVGAGAMLSVTNTISRSGATVIAGIDKLGSGTLLLSGNNTYLGRTVIGSGTTGGGTLIAGHNNALSLSNVTLTGSGSALQVADGVSLANDIIVSDSGNNKTVGLASGATSGEFSGNITINEITAANFDLSADVGGTLTISGTIGASAGANINKEGAGTVVLTGANSAFDRNVTINAGTLLASNNLALGAAGTVTLANTDARLDLANGITITNNLTVGGTGNNKTVGLQSGASSALYAGEISIAETGQGNFDVFADTGGTLTISNVISGGTAGVSKEGAGTVVLSGANTYGDGTFVNAGTLTVTGGVAIPDASAVVIADVAGATLSLQSDETIGSLSGGGASGGTVDLGANALTVGDATTTFFGGTITNTGSLVKQGAGALVLMNDNTYTGSTTVREGVLLLGSANALPGGIGATGGTSALILTNGGIIGLAATDFLRGTGTGSDQVQWAGDGGFAAFMFDRNVNLGGATGTVTWGSGDFVPTGNRLILGAAGASNTVTILNPIAFGASDRTVLANDGAALIDGRLSGELSGTGGLVKEGAGTLALATSNTYSGDTLVAGGVLRIEDANALPGGVGASGGTSALILSNSGVIGLAAGDFFRGAGTGADQVQWAGSGGFAAYGADRVVNLGGATGTVTWGSGGFVSNEFELILATAEATHTLDFQNHIVLSGTNLFRADQGAAAIDGRLSGDLSGSGSFFKTGLGVIELTGSNTYSGATEVLAGDLVLGGANALSPNTWLIISNFNVVTLGAADFTNALGSGTAGTVEWTGSGGFAAHGADRIVNLGGATGQVTWGSGFFVPEVVDNSTLVLGSASASNTVDFLNPIDLGFSNRTVQANDGFAAIDGKLSGVLSGAALATETNFTKTGAGTLALTAANTYTGLTVVSAGALRAVNDAALGLTNGGTIVNSGAALEMEGGITIGAEDLTLGGTGIGGAGALRNVSGSNVFQGNVFLSANTTFGSDAGILVLDGDAILGAEGTERAVTFNGPGDFVVNSLVSNATTFNKIVGTGTLTLNGASLHTGNTVIREGTLKLGADNVLPENSTYVANLTGSFATLDIAGRTDAIGALILGQNPTADGSTNNVIDSVGGGLLRLGGAVTYDASGGNFTNAGSVISANLDLNNATRVFNVEDSALATDDLVVSGTITNSGATASGIRKDGAGTLVFSGSNTYDGLTSVNGGTLVAANNQAFGSVGYISMTNTGARLELADGITIDRNMIVESRAENKTLAIRGGASVATYAGDITILEATANNFDIAADAGGTLTISGVIGGGGAAGVEKVGAGTVVLASNNTYTGQTTISEGVLQVGNGGVSGTLGGGAVTNNSALVFNRSDTITVANAIRGTGTLTNAGAGKTILTAANNFSGGSVISDGALELRAATSGGTGDIRLNGGDLWLLNNSGTTYGNDIFVDVNGSIYMGRTTLGAAVTHTVGDITLGAGRTLIVRGTNLNNNVNYTLAAGDLILAGDGTLDIREGPGSGDGTVRVNNVLAGGAGQDLVVKGNDPNQSQLFINDGLFVGGDLIVGTNALVRTPDGGTNVAGNINLRGGLLGINMDFTRDLGTGAGQVQLTSDGTRQSGFSAFDNPVVVRIEDGGGNLTNLVWGSSTFDPGQLTLNQDDANSTIELQNSIDLNAGSGSVDRTFNVYANVGTISGAISNGGAGRANFVKGGGGTLSLTGASDWNGQTRITAGTLRVTNVTALATSFASSNLFLNPGNAIGVLETQGLLTNALGGGVGQVRIVGGGNAGQNARPGFSAYGGDLTIDLGGDGTGTGSQLVWGSADFNVSGPSTNNGALLLNTANADGTVRLMNDIDLNGQDLFLAGPDYRRIEVNGSTAVLGGDISNGGTDPVGILKRGAGTLVMAGNNTYDGLTEVAAGTLLVNGSHFGGGDYTVSGGTTLGGTGTIGSAVLIASNAVMSPGNSIGTFTTTNNFTFSTGGVLQIELDHVLAASDMLVVSGALDISGAILSLTNLGTGGDLALLDDTYIIAQYGSLIGDTFFNHADVLGLLPTGYEIEYNYLGGNQIALVIPEPGAIAALLLGGVVVGALARRRRATMAATGEARR